MRRITVALAVLLVAFAACEEEPPPPPVKEEPPPPTPQEIAQKFISEQKFNSPVPPPGWVLPKSAIAPFRSAIRTVKNQNTGTEGGAEALLIISQALDRRLRQLEDAELWDAVILIADAYEILNPASKRFKASRQIAETELRKPKVTILGITDFGQKVAMLSFYLPLTGETFKENVRVGEEFYGLRFVSIIGRDRGVNLEYLETGETFEVLIRSLQ